MTNFLLSDAELHGLVDGQIEMHRRADVLRRAATSTLDRERIGSWQSQCELIRAAFQGIDREPLPSALDLRAPAKLHAILPARGSEADGDEPPIVVAPPQRSRMILPSLASLVAAAGLAVTWLAGGFTFGPSMPASDVAVRTDQLVDAQADATPAPAATIPDLSSLGFTFSAAEMRDGEAPSMLFRYRNGAAQRLTLSVARSASPPLAPRLSAEGKALTWQAGPRSYSLAGTLPEEQMRALVPAIRALALEE